MKYLHNFFILLSFLFISSQFIGQGVNCADADPFCTQTGSNFPASTNTTAQTGANYGCLLSQPNPAWYYLRIGTNGNIEINLNNSSGVDIDFAIWGPFASATGGCLPTGSPIDCSFSTAATEVVNINNAVAGQFYLLLITNFSGQPTNISATAGNAPGNPDGTTDCSIVNPVVCSMTGLTASVSACSSTPTLAFTAGGTVTYTNPPTTGTLTVTNCYGQQQVFNPPFGTSVNYSFPGLPQDGLNCNITATFSAATACTITTPVLAPSPITNFSANCTVGGGAMNGTITFSNGHPGANLIVQVSDGTTTQTSTIPMPSASPANWSVTGLNPAVNPYTLTYFFSDNPSCSQTMTVNCGCSAEGGTTSASINGNSTNNYILCEDDELNINTNNDFTFPDNIGPLGGFAFQPGLAYLIYSCVPTPGLFPGSDPCFEGLIPVTNNLQDFDDAVSYFQSLGGAGTFTNNQLFFTPITLYHYDPVGGNYIINSNCWDIANVTQVTYLNPIQNTIVPNCTNGTAVVTLTGGYPQLFGGNFTASGLTPATASFGNTTATHGGTITINGLQNGDMYSFTVTDGNGCPHTVSGGPFVGTPTAAAGTDAVFCALTGTLGATPLTFGTGTWTGPAGITFTNATSPTSGVNATAAGSYTLTWTATNGAGCTTTDQVIVQFSNVQLTQTPTNPTCGNPDGQIVLSGNSGIAPYTYSINGGTSSQTTGTFTGLLAGTYNIVVTDALNCTATAVINLSNQGGPVINAINPVNINCNGQCTGSISIDATGATQFSIDNGATFQALNTFTALCDGTYNIVVEDAIGCSITGTTTITEPSALASSTTQVDLSCANVCIGSITATANGGTTPYQFSIDNGATNQINNTFSNLCAGNYTVLVTDALGCTSTNLVTIIEPTPITLTLGITNATCTGLCNGMINSIPAGGTGVYSYTWTPAVGGNVPLVTNICAGTYSLTVTDANGCSITDNNIVVTAPAAVSITSIDATPELCGNDCTGSIEINSAGSTEFSINNGATFQADNIFNNLCQGTYDIIIQDANGCQATDVAIITGPTPVTISSNGSTTICIGGTAPLTATANGGVGGFTYTWDNGGATQNINVSPIASQNYCVFATDANGCVTPQVCELVTLNPALSVVALSDQSICIGQSAQISAIASGGNGGPYTYTWNQGVGVGQNQTVTPNFTTVYTVTVTDNCGTPAATASITITVNTTPNISFSGDVLSGCAPVTTTFTDLNVPAGSTCLWSFGDGGISSDCNIVNYTFNQPGCWDVTLSIVTPEGCPTSVSLADYICAYEYPIPNFTFEPQPTTVLNTEINFTNTTTNGVTYIWSFDTLGVNGSSTSSNPSFIFPTEPGSYTVCLEAFTIEGCPAEICQDVIILDEFIVYVPNAFTPDGDAKNPTFFPVISGIDPLSYEFLIFNRWGELIFQSQFPGQGWDGVYNGLLSQQDVYVWKLKVTDVSGKSHSYIGHVTLIR